MFLDIAQMFEGVKWNYFYTKGYKTQQNSFNKFFFLVSFKHKNVSFKIKL